MIDLAVYGGLFLAAFTAATLLPAQSEILVVGLLLTEHPLGLVLTVAAVTPDVHPAETRVGD